MLTGTGRALLGSGRGLLPISEDFTTQGDGAMSGSWTAPGWTIASGRAVFTPTFGAELLTDPGLEAAYASGTCGTLTKGGSPTVAESADVHGGSKAQAFTGVAGGNSLDYPAVTPTKHSLYQFSAWGKYPGGAGSSVAIRLIQSSSVLGAEQAVNYVITPASYAQFKVSLLANSTNNLTPRIAREDSGAFHPIILDDGSLKAITNSPFALRNGGRANVNARVTPPGNYAAFIDGTWFGLVARADVASTPTNYIMAVIHQRQNGAGSNLGLVSLFKRVGETYTNLVVDTLITLVNGGQLEIRCNGTTVSVWYNSLQVGSNQTVSDAELINNTYYGMYSAGGNFAQSFFLDPA